MKFYTKWCKFCKILAPEYEKVIDELKYKRSDIVMARLEGDEMSQSILLTYGIDSFPQVLLFYPGDKDIGSILHSHDRNVNSLLNWIDIISDSASEDNFLTTSNVSTEDKEKDANKDDESAYILFELENKTELNQLRKKYLNLIIKYNKLFKVLEDLNSKLSDSIGINMKIDETNIQVGNIKMSKQGFVFYLFIFIGLVILIVVLCFCFNKIVS